MSVVCGLSEKFKLSWLWVPITFAAKQLGTTSIGPQLHNYVLKNFTNTLSRILQPFIREIQVFRKMTINDLCLYDMNNHQFRFTIQEQWCIFQGYFYEILL